MNIKELKEFIKDLPDDMNVTSCCSEDTASVELFTYTDDDLKEVTYLWVGYES